MALPSHKVDLYPPTGANDEIAAADWNSLIDALDGTNPGDIDIGDVPVVATGSTALRTVADRFGETVNIRDHGAVGDGATDDSDALIAAIAVLEARTSVDVTDYAQGGGGKVYCPRGVYKITKQIAWTADGITIEGEGENATAFKVVIASSPTTTDVFVAGDGSGNGRRACFKDLSIYTDTNFGTNKCRDFIVIRGGVWWKLQNVNLRGAGRYGYRIAGTYHGKADYVRSVYNGDSGMCVENEGATPQTTSTFFNCYWGYNYKHGIHLKQSNTVTLYMPVIEYNGQNADPTDGNGIRMGDAGLDVDVGCNIVNGYFESNQGWDILTGEGSATSQHLLTLTGGWASAVGAKPKTVTYGFLYAARTAGRADGTYLADYTSGLNYKTFSLDSTCKFNIAGVPAGGLATANNANAPVIRDGSTLLDDYEGTVEWYDEQGVRAIRGRYGLRLGNEGVGAAALKLQRGSAKPAAGTWRLGDLVVNSGVSGNTGREIFAWRCYAAGTPGSWEPLFCSLEPDSGLVVIAASAATIPVDASYRVWSIQYDTDVAGLVGLPNDGSGLFRPGRIFTVVMRNNSGAPLTNANYAGNWKWAENTGPGLPDDQTSHILTFFCDGTPGSAFEISRSLNVPF